MESGGDVISHITIVGLSPDEQAAQCFIVMSRERLAQRGVEQGEKARRVPGQLAERVIGEETVKDPGRIDFGGLTQRPQRYHALNGIYTELPGPILGPSSRRG